MAGESLGKIEGLPFVSERELSQLAARGWRWVVKIITRLVFADVLRLGTSRARALWMAMGQGGESPPLCGEESCGIEP